MNELDKFKLITILTVLQFTLDIKKKFKTCKNLNPYLLFILIIHHIISVFLHFGWIFDNKIMLKLYIATVISVIGHQNMNNGKCFLTQIENKICEFKTYHSFTDFYYWLGLKDKPIYHNIYVMDVFVVVMTLYAFLKING